MCLADSFLGAAIAASDTWPTLKLTWLTSTLIWVDQWLLSQEKLAHLEALVEEHLNVGHLVPSTSPWNTPVFTIPKKSGKWRLLQDLRAVNAVMQDMGPLQPGLPTPAMLPKDWYIVVIDLKDCFFTIPLHPDDCEKFAFTIPSVNRAAPAKRYHWVVLPQGMKNSPTICQWYVDLALQKFRKKHQSMIIYHYMDDLLLCQSNSIPTTVIDELKANLEQWGLVVAPEKIQTTKPWKYLGMMLTESVIRPQKLAIRADVCTLNNVQKLVGDIQWVRNVCGVTNTDLQPLFDLLQDGQSPQDLRDLTSDARSALLKIAQKVAKSSAARLAPDLPINLYICNTTLEVFGLLGQWDTSQRGPLQRLEWVFLPAHKKKTITTRWEAIVQVILKGTA